MSAIDVHVPTEAQRAAAQQVLAEDVDRILERGARSFDALAASTVWLTGGAGFLGYEWTHALVEHNRRHPASQRIHIELLDNLSRGLPEWLQALDGAPGLHVRRYDVTDPLPEDLPRPDWIVHGASIASPTFYRRYPLATMDANVGGLRRLLDHARGLADAGTPLEGMLFFSTSEIYGDPVPEAIPTPETYRGNVSCTGPRACYDESKRYGETLCVTFADEYGVPVRTARPFNNYGPGLKLTDRRVLPDFARDVLAGRDIVLLSDGSPTRTFCYVADAVVGYLAILTHGRAGEPYNIGADAPEISMRDLAGRVAELGRDVVGYEGQVTFADADDAHYLTDNPVRRCPDLGKARAELGYDTSVALEEGLRRALVWYAGSPAGEDA